MFISGPIFGPIFMGPISGPIFMGPIAGPIYPVWAGLIYPVWAGPAYPQLQTMMHSYNSFGYGGAVGLRRTWSEPDQ